jgi:predicted nucleic-acid-binding Zn-ribbon protein
LEKKKAKKLWSILLGPTCPKCGEGMVPQSEGLIIMTGAELAEKIVNPLAFKDGTTYKCKKCGTMVDNHGGQLFVGEEVRVEE